MADYLKSFVENEKILASETNSNNQYLLNQINDRAGELQAYLEGEITKLQGSFVQPGFIIAIPYQKVPFGFLKCDGSSLLREEYADLFSAIGTIYGYDDDYHFNLPDFRGAFLRGAGGKAASLGVKQAGGVPNITGFFGGGRDQGISGAFYNNGNYNSTRDGGGNWTTMSVGFNASRSSSVYKDGLSEVRPDNYAVNWIIKY